MKALALVVIIALTVMGFSINHGVNEYKKAIGKTGCIAEQVQVVHRVDINCK